MLLVVKRLRAHAKENRKNCCENRKISLAFKTKLRVLTEKHVPLLRAALHLTDEEALAYWNDSFMPTIFGAHMQAIAVDDPTGPHMLRWDIVDTDATDVTMFLSLKM